MAEFRLFRTLRARGMFWTVGSLLAGIAATWIWMASQAAWQAHLNRAFVAGLALYETMRQGAVPPPGMTVEKLARAGANNTEPFPGYVDFPSPAYVTEMSIITDQTGMLNGTRLQLQIVSGDLKYPVANMATDDAQHSAARLGNLTRLLASYCSEPVIFARLGQGDWYRIDGTKIWGCGVAPRDNRLFAFFILIVALILFLTQVTDTAANFSRFSANLRQRGNFGRRDILTEEGPEELREIVRTVNEYLAMERDRLQQRAMILSGVSHDLGTPATRLRLRTALIEEDELRNKLESDIDQMTGMIESVLTYTRSEMNVEEPRQISLSSLVESIVADYEDVGKPVRFVASEITETARSRSVFGGGGGNLALPQEDARRVLVIARPVSLQRAISNLIDNSLKYGRRATVSLVANSETVAINVEDEGTSISEDAINALVGPFQRGENAELIEGAGLGLTIVATIARQHGGGLAFERISTGLRAVLTVSRR